MAETAIFSFRLFQVGASGAATQSSSAVFHGNIRILGGWAIFIPRGPPIFSCKGVWYANPKFRRFVSRKYSAGMGFMPFFSFRGLPVCPCKGVWYGNPNF